MNVRACCVALMGLLWSPLLLADQGRLLATGGATSLEGQAGGGIVPWAVLAGYAEEGEWGGYRLCHAGRNRRLPTGCRRRGDQSG